jgi:hypothetical protein
MFEKSGYVLLGCGQKNSMTALQELGEGLEVAVVGLAGKRAQAFFDAQIGHVLAKQAEIARRVHS